MCVRAIYLSNEFLLMKGLTPPRPVRIPAVRAVSKLAFRQCLKTTKRSMTPCN
jgi:hypothetical protein